MRDREKGNKRKIPKLSIKISCSIRFQKNKLYVSLYILLHISIITSTHLVLYFSISIISIISGVSYLNSRSIISVTRLYLSIYSMYIYNIYYLWCKLSRFQIYYLCDCTSVYILCISIISIISGVSFLDSRSNISLTYLTIYFNHLLYLQCL